MTEHSQHPDLIAFFRARLDEDEITARSVPVGESCRPPAHWTTGADPDGKKQWVLGTFDDIDAHTVEAAGHIARHDPARVLAEVEAKRRVVDALAQAKQDCDAAAREGRAADAGLYFGKVAYLRGVVMDLALPHAEHKDYREEWRP